MATGFNYNIGCDLARDIITNLTPRYWNMTQHYEYQPYLTFDVCYDEYLDISRSIALAQIKDNSYCVTEGIQRILRIQNPFAYSRFIIRRRQMQKEDESVFQCRKYKIINRHHLDLALKYNCDSRRYGFAHSDLVFSFNLPKRFGNNVVLVAQVLVTEEDHQDDFNQCLCDSDFYLEYIVFF